jgi:hypothetical protein
VPIAAPPPQYATAPAAMRAAVREAVARRAPRTRPGLVQVTCTTPADVGETTVCDGSFRIRSASGARTYYVFTTRSRVRRQDAGTLSATLDAVAYRPRATARRHLPPRLTATHILARPAPPSERTIHADIVIQHGTGYGDRRLSRDRRLAFAVPTWFRQAYDEGPVTVPGAVEHSYDLPPGGLCRIRLTTTALVTAAPPVEMLGGTRLLLDPDDDHGGHGQYEPKILERTAGHDPGTVTYKILEPGPGAQPMLVSLQRAPAGIAPAGLPWLVITTEAQIGDPARFGRPGADGYPVLDPLPAQARACEAAAARTAAVAPGRVLATATITTRPRPPRADPDDEAPLPVEPTR